METRGGVYWKIRDKTLSVEDRVKLVRYAWKHDSVAIPNKEQALLDWLCLCLAGKQRVTGEDAESVWRCFNDVVHTAKCHRLSLHGQQLVLKNIIYQVLLSQLESPSIPDDIITSCCHAIVTSSNLGYTFTSKHEYMLHLTSVLLQRILKTDREPTLECLELLLASLHSLSSTQLAKASAQQVAQQLANKVFLAGVTVFYRARTRRKSQDGGRDIWQETEAAFHDVVNSAAFSKELQSYFDLYLKLKTDDTKSESSPPKSIDAIFEQIVMATEGKDVHCQEAMLDYLPLFYQGFINAYGAQDSSLQFKLLMHLGNILCLKPVSAGSPAPPDQTLLCVRRLLELAVLSDAHDVSKDVETGGKQLKWLKNLAEWMLTQKNRSPAWFECQLWLLKLNHTCLEEQLPLVITVTWLLDGQLEDQAGKSQDELLCHLVATYDRLRQIPKLYNKILQGINGSSVDAMCATWPETFENRLAEAVTSLPQTTTITLWKTLLSAMEQTDSTPELASRFSDKMATTCDLVSHFLLHVKVADYSITHQVATQVEELLQRTAEILGTLIGSLTEKSKACNPRHTSAVLHLVWSWSELHILLKVYRGSSIVEGSFSAVTFALHHSDLTFICPMLDAVEWDKVFKNIMKSEDKQLSYILGQLVMQKARALATLSDSDDPHTVTSLQNSVTFLCTLTSYLTLTPSTSWDGRMHTITTHNRQVALWSLVCQHLPYIAKYAETELLQKMAQDMVFVLADQKNQSPEADIGQVTTLRGVIEGVIGGTFVEESTKMQRHLLNAVWHTMADVMCETKSPSKSKQRKGSIVSLLYSLGENMDDPDLPGVQDLVNMFTSDSAPGPLPPKKQKHLVALLKILELLPVEHFLSDNQSRCIVGLFTILARVNPDQTGLNRSKLVETGFSLLSLVLSSFNAGSSDVVETLGISRILTWMLRYEGLSAEALSEDLYTGVQTVLLKQSLREASSLKMLDEYISQVTGRIQSMDKRTSEPAIGTLVNCIKVFGKVLVRAHVREDIGETCRTFHHRLSSTFTAKLLGQNIGPTLDVLTLEGYSSLLDVACKTGNEASLTELKKELGTMCDLCLEKVLEDDADSLKACVHFTRVVSGSHAILEEDLSEDFLQKNCENFIRVLQRKKGADTSTANQDAAMDSSNQSESRRGFSAELQEVVEQTLGVVISVLGAEDFQKVIQRLLEDIDVGQLDCCHDNMVVAMEIWQKVMQFSLSEESGKVLCYGCQTMILKLQRILIECSHREQSLPHVVTAALATIAKMLAQGPSLLTPQCASLSLQSCCHGYQFTRRGLDVATFCAVFTQMYEVLNQVLVQHTDAALEFIPAFMSAANCLLIAVIQEGQQRETVAMETEMEKLVECGRLMDRLFSLVVTHQVEFSKVAAYTVANYVSEVQKVTLIPKVKKALVPGIYKLLELCDQHATAQLHTILPAAGRQIFKTLYEDYEKFYKYTGKI